MKKKLDDEIQYLISNIHTTGLEYGKRRRKNKKLRGGFLPLLFTLASAIPDIIDLVKGVESAKEQQREADRQENLRVRGDIQYQKDLIKNKAEEEKMYREQLKQQKLQEQQQQRIQNLIARSKQQQRRQVAPISTQAQVGRRIPQQPQPQIPQRPSPIRY